MLELVICTLDGRELRRLDLSTLAEDETASLVIGRAEECDIRIRNVAVSRRHCEIRLESGRTAVVRDLGSTHGTLVAGVPVKEQWVPVNADVHIGPALLRLVPRGKSGAARGSADRGAALR